MKKILLLVFLVCLFAAQIALAAYPASSFYSFYQEPQTIGYSDSNGQYAEQQRSGYQNLYNLDDPIIRCNSVNPCGYNGDAGLGFVLPGQHNLFRVFVAPGTTSVTLTVMLSQPSQFFVIARMGIPPTGDYSSYNPTNAVAAALPTGGFILSQLRAGDCIGHNSSGFLNIVGDYTVDMAGGWIYVILIGKQGYVTNNSYTNTVNVRNYLSWFKSVDWNTFDTGGVVIPTPTPVPPPQPTPTPEPGIHIFNFGELGSWDWNGSTLTRH